MDDFCQPSIQMFGSLFEKPKMSQKLLQKPPFRYIFDIIFETTKVTGYANGLYQGQELDSKYYDDKDKKIHFLKKIIELTQLVLYEEIHAEPTKIVQGLEPDQTNLMLQAVYRAAISGNNSHALVEQVRETDFILYSQATRTRQMFSSLIQQPKMSDNLLVRPPFKYIFDIITETISFTGYANGLYQGEELDINYYVDNRDRKIAFLNKIKNLTQFILNEVIQAEPAKIVQGLEPEQTNLMLQAIYRAAISGEQNDALVQQIISMGCEKEQVQYDPRKYTVYTLFRI